MRVAPVLRVVGEPGCGSHRAPFGPAIRDSVRALGLGLCLASSSTLLPARPVREDSPRNPSERPTAIVVTQQQRPAPPSDARLVAPPAPSSRATTSTAFDGGRFVLETAVATFDEMVPGIERSMPGALAVRVFASRDWELRLAPSSALQAADGGESVPVSRISWRSATSGGFRPFEVNRPVVIARGVRTTGAGELVLVDLRMLLSDEDPLGRYTCFLGVFLEPR